MGFKPNHIYPLKDADTYDDEDWGVGFDHVYIPGDIGDVSQCYICDAWVVNAAGENHPGYEGCPVPIHVDAVDLNAGRAVDLEMPERASPFAAFA